MALVASQQRVKSTRLGKAEWTDPERRQSIKDDTRVKMEWRLRTPLHIMKCWVPLRPAKPCLLEAMEQVEKLIQERTRTVWDGEKTSPGCSYDVAMHGRSVDDAQPTVIFCSPSKICRRNAANIIVNQDILVDPRGIGMEYYSNGPDFYAGFGDDLELGINQERSGVFPDLSKNLPSSSKGSFKSSSSSHQSKHTQGGMTREQQTAVSVNGSLISIQSTSCTLGGLISIDGELYGLTVAHVFERDGTLNLPAPIVQLLNGRPIGSLREKRYVPIAGAERQRDLDWAVCSLDRAKVHLTNNISLPDGTVLYPTQIALQNPPDADVWVHTGTTGLVKGSLTGLYSLVALPGSRTFQRMWIVVLDRLIRPGDCGSWVIDSTNGIWYGQIVAAKPESAVAYIILARDIFRDIRDQFGGRQVRMPIESDFINEAVSVVKRELSRSISTSQGSSPQESMRSNIAGKGESTDILRDKSGISALHGIRLIQQFTGRTTFPGPENLASGTELQSLGHIHAREAFLQTYFKATNANDTILDGREWYTKYLESCFREHFECYLLPTLPGLDQATISASSIGSKNIEVVYRFIAALARILLSIQKEIAICEIVDDLLNNGYNFLEEDGDRVNIGRLVLIAMGWLTMSMPYPTFHPMDGSKYEGREIFVNQQELAEFNDQSLSMLLIRKFKLFENLLDPPPLYREYGQNHTSQYFMTSTICFRALRELGRIKIIWTEQLPLHLKLNRRRRTLTLFAFPSFALAQCRGNSHTILARTLQNLFTLNGSSAFGPVNRPSAEDLCREILLSYRLIFGLDRSSYKLYSKECKNERRLCSDFDPLLTLLCGRRWNSLLSNPIFEMIEADPPASYYLTSDFPVLGHKLFELHNFIQGEYPSSFRALWHDRRDTSRWFTFWAILLVGGSVIILTLIQTIFQVWQGVTLQKQLQTV